MEAIENNQISPSLEPEEPERILFLDNVRAVAIIMVVGVHTLGYCAPLPHGLNAIVSFIVTVVAVPVFFLVDGYLFARNVIDVKSYTYLKHVRKSLFRLLVPWAFFTLFYTLARYGFELMGFLEEKLILGHTWGQVVIAAYGSVYAPQMYFLLSLFLIRLCSPLLQIFVLRKRYFVLFALFICYYAAYEAFRPIISPYLTIKGGQEPILHALWGAQFYLVGIILYRISDQFDLKVLFVPILLVFISSLVIQGVLGVNILSLVQYLYLLTFFLFFACFRFRLRIIDLAGRNTMGIYLLHAPMLLKGSSLMLQKVVFDPMLSFVSILFGTFVISLLIVVGINRVPYGCLLFGARYQEKNLILANKGLG